MPGARFGACRGEKTRGAAIRPRRSGSAPVHLIQRYELVARLLPLRQQFIENPRIGLTGGMQQHDRPVMNPRQQLGECLLISMPFYVLGTGIYIFLLHAVLKKNYPYISDVYSLKVYALIFALYIVILMLAVGIMVLSHINQSIVSQLKEKKI